MNTQQAIIHCLGGKNEMLMMLIGDYGGSRNNARVFPTILIASTWALINLGCLGAGENPHQQTMRGEGVKVACYSV